MKNLPIPTDRLFFREYTADDLESLHAILSDPLTMRFWPAPFTYERTVAWLERSIESSRVNGFSRWALCLRSSGRQIGDCGFIDAVVDGRRENDIGYIIHAPYWRQGYAVEAARASLEHGFRAFGMDRIIANMAHDHIGSQRVAERIGMKKEKEFLNERNRGIPTCLYAISREDFERDPGESPAVAGDN